MWDKFKGANSEGLKFIREFERFKIGVINKDIERELRQVCVFKSGAL